MILAIERAANCSGLTTKEKPRMFFSLKKGLEYSGLRTRTTVSLAPIFFAKTAETILTSSCSVIEIKISQDSIFACSKTLKLAPFPRIPIIS